MNERQKEVVQTQVDREKETLDLLKLVFGQAQDDCANKIIELSMRRDMENLQTIIWQKKYQEAIKGQLDGILDNLLDKEYKTVSDYLHDCYENGYIGTMYDLAGQDIPLIMPIDQKQVVRAVELDAKLTTKKRYTDDQGNRVSLYEKLGANVDELKKDIRFQLGRGIANGSSWNQIGAELAKGMKHTPFEKAMNRTVTIARTEGHRIQCQAAMDAQYKAKAAGADVLKQWDSTLDGKTRETHRQLDGQIRELDDPFEVAGKKAMRPGGFDDPAEDCNCRCAMLQRARWALDEDELDELKERAEFFGLDKTKDFEEFKEKYLNVTNEKDVMDTKIKNIKEVTNEYSRMSTPGIGTIVLDIDAEEWDKTTAKWIFDIFGGNIHCLKADSKIGKMPDSRWNNCYWEFKKPTSRNAIGDRMKKGLRQIAETLKREEREEKRGLLIDISDVNISYEDAVDKVLREMNDRCHHETDVIVKFGNDYKVFRKK